MNDTGFVFVVFFVFFLSYLPPLGREKDTHLGSEVLALLAVSLSVLPSRAGLCTASMAYKEVSALPTTQ